MQRDEYPDKTVYVNEGVFPVAAFSMSRSPSGGSDVTTWLPDEADSIAVAGVLMIAAIELVPPHMRVKLMAMLAEITEIVKAQQQRPPNW